MTFGEARMSGSAAGQFNGLAGQFLRIVQIHLVVFLGFSQTLQLAFSLSVVRRGSAGMMTCQSFPFTAVFLDLVAVRLAFIGLGLGFLDHGSELFSSPGSGFPVVLGALAVGSDSASEAVSFGFQLTSRLLVPAGFGGESSCLIVVETGGLGSGSGFLDVLSGHYTARRGA